MTVSDKDLKAFEELVRPGAVYRLSETLPEGQKIRKAMRDTTQKLAKALNLEPYEAEAVARFIVQKITDHFEDSAT